MTYSQEKFQEFVSLTEQNSAKDGPNLSSVENFGTFKVSTNLPRTPMMDIPAIWVVGQGKKICHVGKQRYEFSPGKVVVMFYPMPVEYEIQGASPEAPYLVAGVLVDLGRIADVLLRLDRIEGAAVKPVSTDPSGIFSIPLNDNLLAPFIRLFKLLENPTDAAMLSDSIIEEIHYRLLMDERGGELRFLLQQRGEIQRISKAVNYIHQNLDKPVSVESLAEMVHMGQTSFYENFKGVMHVSPLQYAKSVKLHRAQTLIQEGKKANEAAYMVGYNSPAQFSREYKRHFGFVPSETLLS
jgi:AraC-like DNA-binding protein